MKQILEVLGSTAAALLVVAAAVFGLGDASLFVSPPEAVVEGFVRELAAGRWSRARPHLSRDLARRTSARDLRAFTRELEGRTGDILDVRGERDRMAGDEAEAHARIETRAAGTVRLHFRLRREQGVWAISDLGLLALPVGSPESAPAPASPAARPPRPDAPRAAPRGKRWAPEPVYLAGAQPRIL